MKFLLDSCVSSFAAKELRGEGFEALWVPETGSDPGDDAIIKKAFDEDWILVTIDKDFGELVFVFDKPHGAIIRLVDIPARKQGQVLLRLIKTHQEDIEKTAIITVERSRIRVHHKE